MGDLLTIDGSFGEGGGQILRSALALSVITRRPFELKNIRAGRKKPGLQPQHLECVRAAAEVSRGHVQGADTGSLTLRFEPGEAAAGDYRFDIGTAGSTSLVLHTVYLPLALLGEGSRVGITGGTHVPFSPCTHYLELEWLPLMWAAGLRLSLKLDRPGFYPVGGGKIRVEVSPSSLRGLQIPDRGPMINFQGVSLVANLEVSIAERQRRQAVRALGLGHEIRPEAIEIVEMRAPSPGTALILGAEFEGGGRACAFALGERGKKAEKVAEEAALAFRAFLSSPGAVDEHAGDQLLLPLALAQGPSRFRVPAVTLHLLTNAEVVRRFVDREIRIDGSEGQPGLVEVMP
ncbi:MAG: RNA 3'-terminal phosphate cyclase [Planctomycetes bacterium]|nr:RNA 3'-terminal phosphate cyclase [Planctomycetota bacterium]